jgi:hypothetical protein
MYRYRLEKNSGDYRERNRRPRRHNNNSSCYAQKRILHDHDIAELEESDDGRSEGEEGETAEDSHTGAIAPETPPESDEEEEETEPEETPSEASDITERNSDLPPPPYEQEQSPPRRRQDRFTSLRSPSPPGYVPPTFFQNIYAPPIRLRNEEEYRRHRRELIGQYNRDIMDLFYKYEFHAQELKRARRHYDNN